MDRRKFLTGSALTSLGVWFNGNQIPNPFYGSRYPSDEDFASVIATWPNEKATSAAWLKLQETGYALDAVEAGARVPEADVMDTSVGYGGYPDRDGKVTLDACIMDEKGNAGSVVFLQDYPHPVSVARRVMEKTPHVMLAGEGARRFAAAEGFTTQNMLSNHAREAWIQWTKDHNYQPANHDTIGILALDAKGRLCGACSTSGWAFKMHGRVGDSPIIGAGLYVDGQIGAAACTGLGELVLRNLSSFLCVEYMRQGLSPTEAARMAIRRLFDKIPGIAQDTSRQVGLVAMDTQGRVGGWAVHQQFKYTVNHKGANAVREASYGV